jgi:hypothetical protein
MQRYTIFFIAVNALHISGGFSAHHQKNTQAFDPNMLGSITERRSICVAKL